MLKDDDMNVKHQTEATDCSGHVEPVVSGNYEFTDGDIDYMTEKGKLYIEVDPDRGIWAQIRKKDVEYMMTVFGIK